MLLRYALVESYSDSCCFLIYVYMLVRCSMLVFEDKSDVVSMIQ